DDQIAITINSSDGNTWEYGVPYSRSTGRYMFEEIDLIAVDFGDEFAEQLTDRLDAMLEELLKGTLPS
ncbi:MAG: hypothetical protein QF615_13535, partial [Planctomycetota bacterium]|nr:hypothetical protein [Planctomycetota bacterium]